MTQDEFRLPVGRMVMGSLYNPQTTNAEGAPLTSKDGQSRVEYFFALAIPKGSERHWNETDWGKRIQQVGQTGFPGGQWQRPDFAWKIVDGDSNMPNKKGKKPCEREGYVGNWVLSLQSGFAPVIYNEDSTPFLLPEGTINCGDYLEVFVTVRDNGSQQQPGIFINHKAMAFRGYGARIISGVDPKTLGFGTGALPIGASPVPVGSTLMPAATQQALQKPLAPLQPVVPEVQPHVTILTPPPAAPAAQTSPAYVMTAKANGATREAYHAAKWSDEQLIAHGYMVPA